MIFQSYTRLSAAPLPTEFRLFTAGWNSTEKGKFLFDDKAAQSVMAAYRKWGVDLSIDLEHQMLDDSPSPDPTARDARGWCKLELRPDGSLWAVGVSWTPDGAKRLTNKSQRYVSPAFEIEPKTNRVLKIVNIAMTSTPATHQTPALVAASRTSENFLVTDEILEAVLRAEKLAASRISEDLIATNNAANLTAIAARKKVNKMDSRTLNKIRSIVRSDKDTARLAGEAAGGSVFARRAMKEASRRLGSMPSPNGGGASATVAKIAALLNADANDGDAMVKAFRALLQNAGVDVSDAAPDSDADPDSSDHAPPSSENGVPDQIG